MKTQLLFPKKCRLIGCILFPFAAAWLIATYFGEHPVFTFLKYGKGEKGDIFSPEFLFSNGFVTDFNGECSILLTLVSLFMIAFSREKEEDEYIRSLRQHALQVSIYASYIVLAIASMLFYGFSYIIVLQASVFTLPLIFILVFSFNLHIRPRFSKTHAI